MSYGVASWVHEFCSWLWKTPTPRESSQLEIQRRMGIGFIKPLSKGRGEGTGGCYAAIRGMLTLSQQWGSYLSMQEPNQGQGGQGYLRFLGKRQSGQITPKTNKSRALMMSLSLAWMVLLFPLYIAMNWVCFHYCPCRSNLRTLDTTLLFCFKHIKTAPDMSIPTRGIEKHLGCRLPGLPPWMSASDEGEKNDAL